MSTTAADDRRTRYNPVVATTDFAADFPVFDNDDIKVYVDGVERDDFAVTATYVEGISTDAKAVSRGEWAFDAADLSAEVALDVNKIGFVAPAADPTGVTGAWRRNLRLSRIYPEDAGMIGDDTDDPNAMTNMQRAAAVAPGNRTYSVKVMQIIPLTRIRRLIAGQNLFYIRRLLDQIGEE